jgi:hypothetical protein
LFVFVRRWWLLLLCALNHSLAPIGTIPLPPWGGNPLISRNLLPDTRYLER